MTFRSTRTHAHAKVGVNARNFDAGSLASVRVRMLDGASTWKYLD